jgi:hypothetical protein
MDILVELSNKSVGSVFNPDSYHGHNLKLLFRILEHEGYLEFSKDGNGQRWIKVSAIPESLDIAELFSSYQNTLNEADSEINALIDRIGLSSQER